MTGMWVAVGVAGALCLVAVIVVLSVAARTAGSAAIARTSASAARVAAMEAGIARDNARAVATVALTALGVPDVDAELVDRSRDVSERIQQDLLVAGATAQRINRTAAARARPTPPPSPRDDVWTKPDRAAPPRTQVPARPNP